MNIDISYVDLFLGFLGFGLSIIFCTTICRLCHQCRQERLEREAQQHGEQTRSPIYFIPFPRNLSRQSSEDHLSEPRLSQEAHLPPQYNSVYFEAPPAYNELAFKPEELPPPYVEYEAPPPPTTPAPYATQPPTQPQQ